MASDHPLQDKGLKNQPTPPLRWPAVLGYGAGDFAVQLGLNLAGIYLLYYFTDVFTISAASAGMILLFGRIGLGIMDPIIGGLVDRTRTRWGSKRPFLLWGALPMGLCTVAMFASPDLDPAYRTIYAGFAFTCYILSLSVINVPYSALLASLTGDSRERSVLAGGKVLFAILGTLLAASATKPIAGLFDNEVEGFRAAGIFYACLMVVAVWIAFASVKERIQEERRPSISLKQSVKLIVSNKPFLILAAGNVLFQIALTMMGGMITYLFKYILNAEHVIPFAFLAVFLTAALCTPVFVILSNRISKKFAFNLGMSIMAGALFLTWMIGARSITWTIICFTISGFGMSTMFLSPWAMMPDTVEYSEWKTGIRREGVLFGCFFFFWKLAAAIAGFATGLGLDVVGYIPNAVQTESTIEGMLLLTTIIPAGCIFAGVLILSFYPINEKYYRNMVADIQLKKEAPLGDSLS